MSEPEKVTAEFFDDWNFADPPEQDVLVRMQREAAAMVTNEIINSVSIGFDIEEPGAIYIDLLLNGGMEICAVKETNVKSYTTQDKLLQNTKDYSHPEDKHIPDWIAWLRETADKMEALNAKCLVEWHDKHGAPK